MVGLLDRCRASANCGAVVRAHNHRIARYGQQPRLPKQDAALIPLSGLLAARHALAG
jgi:hypothetical protein